MLGESAAAAEVVGGNCWIGGVGEGVTVPGVDVTGLAVDVTGLADGEPETVRWRALL